MKALIVLAQHGYQDHELEGTRSGLIKVGFQIALASKESGECLGKLGGSEYADVALRDVNVSDYDRIAFVGGPGMIAYAEDLDAQTVARNAAEAGMPLGAICIAPTILAKAGVLQSKKATVWDHEGVQQALLEQYNALYTGDDVTVDGMIVTANGPHAAEEFGATFAAL